MPKGGVKPKCSTPGCIRKNAKHGLCSTCHARKARGDSLDNPMALRVHRRGPKPLKIRCEGLGISYTAVISRISRGMTEQEAMTTPRKLKSIGISRSECERNGLSYQAVHKRMTKMGWSKTKALNTPSQKGGGSIASKCRERGVNYATVKARISKYGFSEEDALAIPLRSVSRRFPGKVYGNRQVVFDGVSEVRLAKWMYRKLTGRTLPKNAKVRRIDTSKPLSLDNIIVFGDSYLKQCKRCRGPRPCTAFGRNVGSCPSCNRHHLARFTHSQIEEMRLLYSRGMSPMEIVKRCGVSKHKIYGILNGTLYASSPGPTVVKESKYDDSIVKECRTLHLSGVSSRMISEMKRIPLGTVDKWVHLKNRKDVA